MLSTWIPVGLAAIEGFALILSPCILPILPLVLAGSLTGGMRRTWGIIAGFVACFTVLAFTSRQLVLSTGIDLNGLRQASFVLLALLGLILLSTRLTEVFNQFLHWTLSRVIKQTHPMPPGGGFLRGFILGGLISIVWTPCAGPILAVVIVQIATQQSTIISFFTLFAFACGTALPMLLIASLSQQLLGALGWFARHGVAIRRLLGGVILCSVAYMQWQETAQSSDSTPVNQPIRLAPSALQQGVWRPYTAPSLQGGEVWFNSKPLNWADLRGHVVLIDFWTYSCINCLRTLPELRQLDQHYRAQGLVVIGVHAPEFAFEKEQNNVKSALLRYGIQYPVVLDNQFIIWRAFDNHYWPAQYLVDQAGRVVYRHTGEGDADILESNIRFLLKLPYSSELAESQNSPLLSHETGETYLGYARADETLSPPVKLRNAVAHFTYPVELADDGWGLDGAWLVQADAIVASAPAARVKLHFSAGQVYAVMGPGVAASIVVRVLLNGQPVDAAQAGADVKDGRVTVNGHRLYHLLALKPAGSGILELVSEQSGLTLYTFTFGSAAE